MSAEREEILGAIRRALKPRAGDDERRRTVEARIAAHRRNLVPARAAALDHAARIELFTEMATEVQTTVARVAALAEVPGAVADYLSQRNLPSRLVMTPDARLDAVPWKARPMLEIRRGRAEDADQVGITACFAGIAETGTLMLVSGPESPTRNNFLPDTHIVVLHAAQVVASYEDGLSALREARRDAAGGAALPRTVNYITGPSRTGDIEQRIELGAHGPRRLHIVLVDDAPAAQP
jgi:L-lactate dehydrogenase complex protein LldG